MEGKSEPSRLIGKTAQRGRMSRRKGKGRANTGEEKEREVFSLVSAVGEC